MNKRVERFRRFVMVSLAAIMLIGNTLACTLPGQGRYGGETPQPIPIDQNESVTVEERSPAINGGDGGPGLTIQLSDGQEVPSVIER